MSVLKCIIIMNEGIYYGQLVVGPAGSGKSTYCHVMQDMAQTLKRNIITFNIDPAAEYFRYRVDIDIRDLITLDDVMEEMELGPNGALIYCMEYLMENTDWLQEELNKVAPDDYVLFDCPGQIELYSHLDVFRDFIKYLQGYGFSLCSVYLMDFTFIGDNRKFLSGMLQALAAQISLELPGVTVLSKCDLVKDKEKLEQYVNFFDQIQNEDLPGYIPLDPLYTAIKKIIDTNTLVTLRELNIDDEDTIRDILTEVDNAIQYGENLEPDDKMYDEVDDLLTQQRGGL